MSQQSRHPDVVAFDDAVRAKMEEGLDQRAAAIAVARADPELHRAYLEATNPASARDLIADRFADE